MSRLFGRAKREAERAKRVVTSDPVAAAWFKGELAELLMHSKQLEAYRQYREWEAMPAHLAGGVYSRIFVLDWGKRTGKTTGRFITRVEDCLRNPRRSYRYVSAFAKNIEEIVDDVAQRVFDSCPAVMRPQYRKGGKADGEYSDDPRRAGTGYYFANGTVLKLAGLDKDPDALRGRASDGDDVSEAGFIDHLLYSVKNVLYHQYQGRPHARMCMESSAPLDPECDYDTVFVVDAELRGAISHATIDDNPMLADYEREEFIRAAGGRDHPDCQREYFNVRRRDPDQAVIPEFDKRHVCHVDPPPYARAFVFEDPGARDMHGVVWAYWHWMLKKLIVQRSWAKRNASTAEVAELIARVNHELWGDDRMTYWDKGKQYQNPAAEVADSASAQVILDMNRDYGREVQASIKSRKEFGVGEAKLQRLRTALRPENDLILIEPDSGPLELHLKKARWNDTRTDFVRSKASERAGSEIADLGHFDTMMALVYGWDRVQAHRNHDPRPHATGHNEYPAAGTPFEQLYHRPQPKPMGGAFGVGSWGKR